MRKLLIVLVCLLTSGVSLAQQTPATGYVPGGGVVTQTGGSGQNPANGYVSGGGITTTSPTTTASPTTTPPETATAPADPTQTAPPTAGSAGFYQVKLQEPLSGQAATLSAANGVDLINQYLSMIYMWAASIVGVIAVLMIVVAGLQIIFGGAHTELVSDAKNRIMQAVISLVLLFGTALLLRTINPNFFGFA